MKRIFLVILAFFYLGVSTGFTMHLHFCMEDLAGISLWHGSEKRLCDNCGMEKEADKKDCCKDEHKQVKLDELHKSTDNTFLKLQKLSFIYFPAGGNHTFRCLILPTVTEDNPPSNSPPTDTKNPIYLKNQIFRI